MAYTPLASAIIAYLWTQPRVDRSIVIDHTKNWASGKVGKIGGISGVRANFAAGLKPAPDNEKSPQRLICRRRGDFSLSAASFKCAVGPKVAIHPVGFASVRRITPSPSHLVILYSASPRPQSARVGDSGPAAGDRWRRGCRRSRDWWPD